MIFVSSKTRASGILCAAILHMISKKNRLLNLPLCLLSRKLLMQVNIIRQYIYIRRARRKGGVRTAGTFDAGGDAVTEALSSAGGLDGRTRRERCDLRGSDTLYIYIYMLVLLNNHKVTVYCLNLHLILFCVPNVIFILFSDLPFNDI